jgi:hypothetical protein
LFALPLPGRRTLLVWLLLVFMELHPKFLDLPALTHAMARGVVHRASGDTIITTRCLTGALVALWALAPTYHYSCGSGSTSQRLVVAANLLLLVVLFFVVATALSDGPNIGLAIPPYRWGR